MKKEIMDEIQKEMQKNLGPMWKVKQETEQKIGGLKEGIVCQFPGDNYATAYIRRTLREHWIPVQI